MRCAITAIQTLAMHPRYRTRYGIMEEAIQIAESLFQKKLDCSFILNVPVQNAHAFLEPKIERLLYNFIKFPHWRYPR